MEYNTTVESIYGVPFEDLTAPEGWEFTGEFRPAQMGETYLLDTSYLLTGEGTTHTVKGMGPRTPGLILRKRRDPVEQYYGAPLDKLTPPKGFEFTGELRQLRKGDLFMGRHCLSAGKQDEWVAGFESLGRYLILRPAKPAGPTIEELYGAPLSELTPPDGWEFTGGFRRPLTGESSWDAHGGKSGGVSQEWGNYIPEKSYNRPYWRLILRRATPKTPTVESVYMGQTLEQLQKNAEKIEGFELTGEFRPVKLGEWFLGATGGNYKVMETYEGIGKWRLIMRERPTIKSVYGAELADLKPPKGYRFTGEFRIPREGEIYMPDYERRTLTATCPSNVYIRDCMYRLILEPLPPTPTIESVYGTSSPTIPAGWVSAGFREVKKGESWLVPHVPEHLLVPICHNSPGDGAWRIVLRPDPYTVPVEITVESIYGKGLTIPEGWRAVRLDFVKPGEWYMLGVGGLPVQRKGTCASDWPRLIVERI